MVGVRCHPCITTFHSPFFASGQFFLARLGTRERTRLDVAGWYIGAHHDTTGGNLRANQPQRHRLGGLVEKALAPPEHHRKSPHVVLVDQRGGLQRPDQVPAADDLQVGAHLRLERGDCRGDIAMQQGRVVPAQSGQRARRNMLLRGIERRRNRVALRLIRPERREYLVSPAPEHQLAVPAVEPRSRDVHALVRVVEHPTAKGKTAGGIFFRSAGRLHDAIQRHECGCNELSHGFTPFFQRCAILSRRCASCLRISGVAASPKSSNSNI